MLRNVALLNIVALVAAQRGVIDIIESDEAFEEKVMQSSDVWVVLFTAKTRHEECAHLQQRIEMLSAMKGESIHFGTADVDDVKAFSSEFNVRKRMVPRALLFSSRARLADTLKVDSKTVTVAELDSTITAAISENPRGSGGRVQKVTLAIGSGSEEKSEL